MRWPVLLLLWSSLIGTSGASAAALEPSGFDAGLQLSHITYKEPDFMRMSGYMFGVTASYTGLGPSLISRIDGTLTFGEVDYVGSLSDGTPITVNNIKDTMFEIRAVFGPADFVQADSYYLPYVGFGFRYLYDGFDVGPGGYRRESNYLYLPLGVEGVPVTRGNWSFGFTVEYDHFIRGKQCSYVSDVNPGFNDVENEQSTGYGYRAALRFIRSGNRNIIIEPFYKYWKIDESSEELLTLRGAPYAYVVEPDNNSTEIGVKFILRF